MRRLFWKRSHHNCNKLLIIVALISLFVYCITQLQLKRIEGVLGRKIEFVAQDSLFQVYTRMKRISNVTVMDSYGTHRVMTNIYRGMLYGAQAKNNSVTLVTQCSINHMSLILHLAEHWDGPVSVSLYSPSSVFLEAIRYILYLHKCYEEKIRRIALHVIRMFPDVDQTLPRKLRDLVDITSIDCINDFQFDKYRARNYDSDFFRYPNNMLRNIAIKAARTEYVFVIDVDMTPSLNLRQHFEKYIQDISKNTSEVNSLFSNVYVVPSFEKDIGSNKWPSNKAELVEMWNSGEVKPFYADVCAACQNFTDYNKWRDLRSTVTLNTSYVVNWTDPWEPFFITHRSAPLYDERFEQYGFNRRSQVCELHIAGYKFAVLNNAFLVHDGYKTPWGYHRSKDFEQAENRALYTKFKDELKEKYPLSSRSC